MAEDYDVAVIDRMLPGLDGLSIVDALRRAGNQTPVLFLTARDSVDDRVKGLELGADDYLVKPFAFAELLARVRVLLRRGIPQASEIIVGDLVIDLGLRLDVFDNNTRVLRDPFALADIYRVDDVLGGSAVGINPITNLPSNIEGDYAVYVNGQTVVGYRDLNGQFYNALGAETDATTVLAQLGGSPQLDEAAGGQLTEDAFEDYEPALTVMPRIGVTFPVTNRALFFASYNVTSQRPSVGAVSVRSACLKAKISLRLNSP